jgi:hypothetical protein
MRHGYGVRNSAPFGKASKYRANKTLRASLTSLRSNEGNTGANPEAVEKRDRRVDDSRGGFVLKMNSAEPTARRRSLGSSNIKKGLLMVSGVLSVHGLSDGFEGVEAEKATKHRRSGKERWWGIWQHQIYWIISLLGQH